MRSEHLLLKAEPAIAAPELMHTWHRVTKMLGLSAALSAGEDSSEMGKRGAEPAP